MVLTIFPETYPVWTLIEVKPRHWLKRFERPDIDIWGDVWEDAHGHVHWQVTVGDVQYHKPQPSPSLSQAKRSCSTCMTYVNKKTPRNDADDV